LDGHSQIGNNALLAKQLGLKAHPALSFSRRRTNRLHRGRPRATEALRAKLEKLYGRVIAIECGPTTPRGVAFCSGAAATAPCRTGGAASIRS